MLNSAIIRRMSKRLRSMHRGLLAITLALVGLGLMMQFSASGGDVRVFALPQAVRALLGLGLMALLVVMPPTQLFRVSYVVYAACLGLLVMVALVGVMGLGAQRWVGIGFFNLQPSELMKIGIILALARYFQGVQVTAQARHYLLLVVPAALTLVPVALILKQPNLGTATIVSVIAFAMCFMAGIRWWYFAGALGAVMGAVPVAYHFLHDYQKQRVLTFLDPGSDPLGAGYNIIQSKIAIGSGGFFGKGLLNGSQSQLDFLPEKQTDFIFTMMAEELGFVGAVVLLVLYGLLIAFAMRLAVHARSIYGRLLAAGVAALLFIHIFINMAMVMGLIPVVGVPLPFLSYGGSFLLTTLMACGLLQHVYIHRDHSIARRGRTL
ncbi:MAG: rod shape-determining protein RodA [Alphaproteobacteria bacterium]|nr:rod shape-determining protein RodA [Alphaproteobacteria bacterium]